MDFSLRRAIALVAPLLVLACGTRPENAEPVESSDRIVTPPPSVAPFAQRYAPVVAPAASSAGRGEGIGLGNIGLRGRSGLRRMPRKTDPPSIQLGAIESKGDLPVEVIQRIVRQQLGRFRFCYKPAVEKTPEAAGKVIFTFAIVKDGTVDRIRDAGSTLDDKSVVSCAEHVIAALSFPSPEGGPVIVTLPMLFSSYELRIHGKPPSRTTLEDVQAALRGLGFEALTVERPKDADFPITIRAKRGSSNAVITFVPTDRPDGPPVPTPEEVDRIVTQGDALQGDGMFLGLVIEGDIAGSRFTLSELLVTGGGPAN